MPPTKKDGKTYTYQRRLVLPILIIMVGTIVLGFILHAIATANNSWGRTREIVEINWGLTDACTTSSRGFDPEGNEIFGTACFKIGTRSCQIFDDASYFGNPDECGKWADNGTISSSPEMAKNMDDLASVRGLSIASTLFSLFPLPFVFLAYYKELKWGVYSMPLYALWFILWICTIVIFNRSGDFVLTYKPQFGALDFAPGTKPQSLYDVGVFLHIGAMVCMAVSCIAFWASYLACFQMEAFDADGNPISIEEVLARRKNEASAVSTVSLGVPPKTEC